MMKDHMKEASKNITAMLVAIGCLAFLALTFAWGWKEGVSVTQTEAIRRGVARYHPVTGNWEWVVPVTTAKEAIESEKGKQ